MEYCIKIKEIFDVIEFKKKKPSAGQINNESINKKWKKNVDNKIERRIKEDWKSFMHARIHKKERMKLTNVNHLCKN